MNRKVRVVWSVAACLAVSAGVFQPGASRAQEVSHFDFSRKKAEMLSRMRATRGFTLPPWAVCAATRVKNSTAYALQVVWLLKREDLLSRDAISASSQDSLNQVARCGGNTKATAVEMETRGDAVFNTLMLATLAAGR